MVGIEAQWLSGRVLDSRPRGRSFEPHRHHCLVVLEQDTFILAFICSKAVVLLLLTFFLLLLPLWESVIVLSFVKRYFISILALQSS